MVYARKEKPKYAYHISGNKGHDSTIILLVTKDLIEQLDDAKRLPLLHIKIEHCSVQYCCLHVFKAYLTHSKSINKPIILYHGLNGHDRGLPDTMSG